VPAANNGSRRRANYPTKVALAFALVIIAAALLLQLPQMTHVGEIHFVDSLFTATSAVCVTGLTTVSLSERFSTAGQGFVLALIQLGGLGITVVSTFLLVLTGRATLSHTVEAEDRLSAMRVQPARLLFWVVLATLGTETLGALCLARMFEGSDAGWQGAFHSVSAFCNAGFSTFQDNLIEYRSNAGVNIVICILIILGGIGFIAQYQVIWWIVTRLRGGRTRLFLHTRVVLAVNVTLWITGALIFGALESGGAMADMRGTDRILASCFHSVSARTAGFNTIDLAQWREPTLCFLMFFMFVGAAPGGAGGGIKVTTFAVILATVRARLLGRSSVSLFTRTVPQELVQRAFLVVSVSLLILLFAVGGLLLSEPPRAGQEGGYRLTELAFEAFSAFGTVGLSTGITPSLTTTGKLIIIVLMYVGRIGPLAAALAVLQPRNRPVYEYPEEPLAIG